MKKYNWGPGYRRRGYINKNDIYLRGVAKSLRRYFPVVMTNFFIHGRSRDISWHFDDDQWDSMGQAQLAEIKKDLNRKVSHIDRMKDEAAHGVALLKDYDQLDWPSFSDSQVRRYYRQYTSAFDHIRPVFLAPIVIDRHLIPAVRAKLTPHYHPSQLDKVLDTVLTPTKPTPIVQEELDLFSLLKKHKNNQDIKPKLKRHLKKYNWVGMRFVDDKPRTVRDLEKHIAKLRQQSWRSQDKKLRTNLKKQQAAFVKTINPLSQSEKRFVRLVNEYNYLRQSRDVYRIAAHYYAYWLYKEMTRRLGVSLFDLLAHTVPELDKFLRTGQGLSATEINNRQTEYICFYRRGRVEVNHDPKDIRKLLKIHGVGHGTSQGGINQIQGTPAFNGLVSGKALVVRLDHIDDDLRSVGPTDILISPSTKPEYVPAMKRAAAVVTDEGGITSHAAIVSRELKIPCVVGTQNGTQVFKNGDKVEVDANRGIVKKIK